MNTKDIEMYQLYMNPETREEGILKACELIENQVRTIFLSYYPGLTQREIYEDVLQECRLEIIRILPRFDIQKNVKFVTFANLYIKNRMMEYINRSVNGISSYKNRTYGHSTFSALDESYVGKSEESTESVIEDIYNKQIVEQFLSCLNPTHQYLLKSYYGIGCKQKTSKDLSKELGITTLQFNRMKQYCIKRMREMAV